MSSPLDALRQTIPALNVISPVGADIAREAQGNYRGEAVATSSESSKLQDAAEELGMSVAHKADKRSLGQRTVRQGQGANLEAIARIADYYNKLPDMPRDAELKNLIEQLAKFEEQLRSGGGGGGGPTKEDVLAALQRFDGDVTHQFAGLEIAREYFAATGAEAGFQSLLDEAYGEFQRTDLARDVRAGFASAEVATRAAATLETDPATVRDTYRQMLREQPNMAQLFDAFRGLDVMKSFGEIVDTFMAAAGRDLASTGPSSDPAFLHSLLTELGKLKQMQSMVDMSGQLNQTMDRLLKPADRGTGDAVDLAARMLAFASKSATNLADARELLGPWGRFALALQVAYANGLRGLHGEIPDDVMPSPQARLQQGSTLMNLLDRLTEDEERAYQGGEGGQPAGGQPRLAGARG